LGLEQTASNSSDVALGAIWARATLDSQTCLETENLTGNLIGTAFVARDMIRVVDALEEDGMLRYWGMTEATKASKPHGLTRPGFSYGTTLGATISAMFPERVDKVILDGVQNPHEYYHATA
jgi:pimeloyl-ACP methyl ester carboxylesterase